MTNVHTVRVLRLAVLVLLALLTRAHADDFLSVQLVTGNDDLRAASRVDVLLELGDNSFVTVTNVTGNVRLPDNTPMSFGPLAIGQSVDPKDIRRVGLRFFAATGGGLGDDKWVVRSMSLHTGSSTTLTLLASAQLDHKFEGNGEVFSAPLPSFDASKLRDMTALSVGIDTDDDNLEAGSTVGLTFGIDGEAPRTFPLVTSTKLVDHNRNYFTVALSPPVPRNKARSVSIQFTPSGNDEWHLNRLEVDATDVAGFDRVFDTSNVIFKTVKLKKASPTFAPPAFPPFPTKPANPDPFLLVLDESQNPVSGAEVFVNETAAGSTDSMGMLDLGATTTLPSNIFVRKRIHEQPTYRANHMNDSTQNWNYRVYLTNAWVGYDGVVTPPRPSDPSQLIVTTIRRDRMLVGLNILVSIEWDGDTSDLIAQQMKVVGASLFLFNATDGQFFIDQCQIMDDRMFYDDADYRVHAEAGLRAEVNDETGAFLGNNALGSSMQMSRTDPASTYAHEFGHYGLDLKDEYDEGNKLVACSSKALDSTSPFTLLDASKPNPKKPGGFELLAEPGNPIASCMMYRQRQAQKLCSARSENPHQTGTSQGDTPCWDKLRSRYQERADGRWSLVTPDDRDAILGPVDFPVTPGGPPGPHPMIATHCVTFPHDEDNTVGHVLLQAVTVTGMPAVGFPVYLQTAADTLIEGSTDVNGQLDMAGCHLNDTVIVGNSVFNQPTGQAKITGPTVTVTVM
jgi:hypothetical protein